MEILSKEEFAHVYADFLCRDGDSPGVLCGGGEPGRFRLSGQPGRPESPEEQKEVRKQRVCQRACASTSLFSKAKKERKIRK